MRRRLLVLLPVLAVLLFPSAAYAANAGTVAGALRSDPVYVDPAVSPSVQLDKGKVEDAVRRAGVPVYVALLPAAAGSAQQLVDQIGQDLGNPTASVIVLTDDRKAAARSGTTARSRHVDAGAALNSSLKAGDATAVVVATLDRIRQQRASSSGGSGAAEPQGSSGGGSGAGLLVFLLVVVLALGGGGMFLFGRSRRRRQQELQGLRADVESLYNRLGSDVSSLSPGDDAVARQCLADAAERYNATGAILAKSDTPEEFAAARRTAVEGLMAARTARQRLGLDPGPEIAPPPGAGPQLQAPAQVQIGNQQFEGSPGYLPGRPHYYGGGYVGGSMVPGGWYSTPFWEPMLLGGILGMGLGGGFGGGYGGGGFDRGYEEGVEDAREARDGGGDWGGGGGDWGGGGGDWGGGGGDWGGGGDGGGGGDW